MALIDLAQGLPNMQHKRILNGNQPQLQLPGVFQPRIQAIH